MNQSNKLRSMNELQQLLVCFASLLSFLTRVQVKGTDLSTNYISQSDLAYRVQLYASSHITMVSFQMKELKMILPSSGNSAPEALTPY